MPVTDLFSSLADNPYFGAGFGLVGVGAGVAALRRGLQYGTVLFKRNYMTTMEVTCRDKSYQWVMPWITANAKNTQHLSVETHFEQHETGKISTHFTFVPTVGVHFFNYKGNWIKVERSREQSALDFQTGQPFETVTLTSLGRNKALYYEILQEARNSALEKHEGKTVMYVARGTDWTEFGLARKRRPIASVVLEEGKTEKLLSDIREFISSTKWYEERGIPYRRGYLLHGPPGCGKTSFITALGGGIRVQHLHFESE
ncbi:Mitochondrial chaperone BCS1 [Halotydeus destructor]|nr:Mitochondrial chaperone BCS1 [Halotydeus destructor]